VAVYREEERQFSVGDRIQFQAPDAKRRITTGELGTIERIGSERLAVRLDDGGREITFDVGECRYIDFGYAVTSHRAQGLGFRRTLVEIDTYERYELVNERTGYVTGSRAEKDLTIYTDSIERLPAALARAQDPSIALDALAESRRRDPAKIEQTRAREIQQTQAQKIEPDRGHDRGGHDRGGYGYSR
jgi:ATP-dependent exoDNAse (exonuclease V) alpha subunit